MSEELLGEKLGGFTIQARVGQGGMASVYRAHQHSLDRVVALKVIRRIPGDTMDVVARFQREKQMMQKLEHPNILPIYDYASNADYLWIAMRLVEGGTLPEAQVPLDRLGPIARQLGSALDFAHSHGVVHRDIKPHNVLMDGDHLYLTDFGVAKMLEQEGLTAPGMAVGTPEYMSPEHLSMKDLDGRSDQYALAVMIYQLACGRLPFTGNMIEVMTAHMRTPPPSPGQFNSKLPALASAAILKAMAKKPEERFPNCSEFAAALSAGLEGSRVLSPPPASSGFPIGKGALAFLVLAGLTAGFFWQRRGGAGQPGPLLFEAGTGDRHEVQLRSLDGAVQSLGDGQSPRFGPGPGQVTLLRGGQLEMVALASKKSTRLWNGVDDFDLSPRGDALVYSQKGLKKLTLAAGKGVGKPAPLNDEGSDPQFSPDGTLITFSAERAIWVLELKGGRRRSLTSPGAGEKDLDPCWSPDGTRLAYLRSGPKTAQLRVVGLQGSDDRALSLDKLSPQGLSWAPNSQIAFTASDGLYTVGPNGKNLQRLVAAPKGVTLSHPQWGTSLKK